MSKKQEKILAIALVLLFLVGAVMICYPYFSNLYAKRVQAEIVSDYSNQIETRKDDIAAIAAAAQEYNEQLYRGEICATSEDVDQSGYWHQLLIEGSNVMCTLTIPQLGISIPVYHGVDDSVLQHGCGHMPQSSLPIGGKNTHAVISGHSGMAAASMLSDLPLLKTGDRFYISVLDKTLVYEVCQTPITVLPHETEYIRIVDGQDLVTLITCVPYGVNTHRLLVRGQRVETGDIATAWADTQKTSASVYTSLCKTYILAGFIGLILFILLVFLGIYLTQKSKKHV